MLRLGETSYFNTVKIGNNMGKLCGISGVSAAALVILFSRLFRVLHYLAVERGVGA